MTEKKLPAIEGKYVLLDTNVLIDISKHPKDFIEFFEYLRAHKVNSVIDQTTKLEFFRGARSSRELETFKEFLKKILGNKGLDIENVPEHNRKLYSNATSISLISNHLDAKRLSLGDVLIAASLVQFPGQIILATQNHTDFSLPIFKRIGEFIVRIKSGHLRLVGFYVFDAEVYKDLLAAIEKESRNAT